MIEKDLYLVRSSSNNKQQVAAVNLISVQQPLNTQRRIQLIIAGLSFPLQWPPVLMQKRTGAPATGMQTVWSRRVSLGIINKILYKLTAHDMGEREQKQGERVQAVHVKLTGAGGNSGNHGSLRAAQ